MDRVGHGNIQRVLALIEYLSRHGVEVDLVYQGNPGVPPAPASYSMCRRVIRVDTWKSSDDETLVQDIESFYDGYEPAPANFGPGTALTRAVRGLLDAVDYTAVIASYAWTAPIFEPLQHRALRIVDLHDVISLHGERAKAATGVASPFSLAPETEQFLWRKWDVLLAITGEEAALVASAVRPTQRVLTVGHTVALPPMVAATEPIVVYAGSDNPTNQQSVSWLLSDVWPSVVASRPDARLRLVGLICDAVSKTGLATTPNVDLAGFVADPLSELAKGAVVVAPYLYGSGLKIKVIEAAGAGRPLVTTTHGVAGSGLVAGTHALVADEAQAFSEAILRVLNEPATAAALGSAARTHVERAFSPDACYKATLDAIRAYAERDVTAGVIPAAVDTRLSTALRTLDQPSVVVWGNGSHTRALLPTLATLGVTVRCIVDKNASVETRSVEGVDVVPASAFLPVKGDAIVLSSQSYESEMWADLEPLRAQGVEMLALYRRELATPRLAAALRPRPSLRATRALHGGLSQSKLVIVEPSAGRSRGPFLRLARAMQQASPGLVGQVIVAGARQLTLQGLDDEDRALIDPTFTFAHWDMLREGDVNTWGVVTRYARFAAADLAALCTRQQPGPNDTVLFHTSNIVDVIAAGQWLGRIEPERRPTVSLLFHFTPEQESQWLKCGPDEVTHAYRVALALLEDQAGPMQVLAQTEELATRLSTAFERYVQPMGFPVAAVAKRASETSGPLRVLFAGEARADKGFGLLPAIADALEAELHSGTVRLVCQTSQNEFADRSVKEARLALTARTGLEIIDRFIPSDEYDRLVAGCDLVLLPYDPSQYRTRLSAVLVDATAAGVPVAVPAGTWMSAQLDAGLGAGVTFDETCPEAIAKAVREALTRKTDLATSAATAAALVQRHHDPRVVLQAILGQLPVAA